MSFQSLAVCWRSEMSNSSLMAGPWWIVLEDGDFEFYPRDIEMATTLQTLSSLGM